MLFNSYTFIFAFLPAAWIAFALARAFLPHMANAVLVMASVVFYGWWDLRVLPLLLGSVALNFVLGRQIARANANGATGRAKFWMVLGIIANLATLGFFKYVDFFLENLALIAGSEPSLLGVILPIGISFFTFQQIGYLADVKAGRSDRYSLVDYALFVSFFPQLIAGPIVHHREMMPQFMRNRSVQAQDMAVGLTLFVAGLFKKVMIADSVAPFSTAVFNAADAGLPVTSLEAWAAALAYTMQIYFDFSGYSDMALGLGRMFGIRLPINFNSPYKSGSIIEFWRRWHITLSRFLRDYLYIPLGGNRYGKLRRHANLLTTMLLGGIWHGAGWGFVIWGALHGGYLICNHALRSLPLPKGPAMRVLGWLITFLAVVFAWVFFRATTLPGALEMTGAMLGIGGLSLPANYIDNLGALPQQFGMTYAHSSVLDLRKWAEEGVPLIVMALALALLAPNTNQMVLAQDPAYKANYGDSLPAPRWRLLTWQPTLWTGVAMTVLGIWVMLNLGNISEFLYFQF